MGTRRRVEVVAGLIGRRWCVEFGIRLIGRFLVVKKGVIVVIPVGLRYFPSKLILFVWHRIVVWPNVGVIVIWAYVGVIVGRDDVGKMIILIRMAKSFLTHIRIAVMGIIILF